MFKYLALCIALWLPVSAQAQDPAPPERLLPPYTECVYNGKRYACYTLEQQRALNLLEENAITWEMQLTLASDRNRQLVSLLETKERRIAYLLEMDAIRVRRIDELQTQLFAEIEAKNKYRADAESTDWWPLLAGGTCLAISVGVIVTAIAISAAD